MAGPFGRALRDHYRGERTAPLVERAGSERREHPVEQFYFGTFPEDGCDAAWLQSWLAGPLVDVGAGVGEHALYFQQRVETVAIEVDGALVETMRERGVETARRADMFRLREAVGRDRFRSVLCHGTQVALAGSRADLRRLLGEFASVTRADATAVVDCYDPTADGVSELFGYRDHPSPGLARREITFEYGDAVGETLRFRLFSPDRLRRATAGTEWGVEEIRRPGGARPCYYRAALSKG